MSLINYVEPARNMDWAGIGLMLVFLTFAVIMYSIYKSWCQSVELDNERDLKYSIIEQKLLERIAKKKGIDLDKEITKRELLKKTDKKSIRKELEDQIYKEMFNKEEKKSEIKTEI